MNTKNTVSRIEKTFSVKFDLSENIPTVKIGNCLVELYKNGGEERLAFVIVRRENDKDDSFTDYFGGSYIKTIKGVIETVNRFNNKAA